MNLIEKLKIILSNKKNLVVFSSLIILLVFLTVFSISNLFQSKKSDNQIEAPRELKILSILPTGNNTSISEQINIRFSRPLSLDEEKSLIIKTSPEIKGKLNSSDNKSFFTLVPTELLTPNTTYQISVSIKAPLGSGSFTTPQAINLSIEDQVKLQGQSDEKFREWDEQNQANYPWLDLLPIQKPSYFFYFDLDKKIFIGKLYPKISEGDQSGQVESFKQEISLELKRLGIDSSSYATDWLIIPEP